MFFLPTMQLIPEISIWLLSFAVLAQGEALVSSRCTSPAAAKCHGWCYDGFNATYINQCCDAGRTPTTTAAAHQQFRHQTTKNDSIKDSYRCISRFTRQISLVVTKRYSVCSRHAAPPVSPLLLRNIRCRPGRLPGQESGIREWRPGRRHSWQVPVLTKLELSH